MRGVFKPKRLDTLCDNLHKHIGKEFDFVLYDGCIDWDETYNGQKAYNVPNHDDMWRWLPEEDIEFCGGAKMTGLDIVTKLAKGGLKEGESFVRLDDWRNMIITMKNGNLIAYWGQAMTWSVHNLNAEWEVYEKEKPKPTLDDWEKELLEKALDHGYTHIKIKDYFVWLIVENGKNAFGSSALAFGFDSLRNNAYKNKNTSIKWLLGSEE